MLKVKGEDPQEEKRVKELMLEIEKLRGRKLFCLYHEMTRESFELIDSRTVHTASHALEKLGRVDKISVLVESPGGDTDETFRLIRLFRKYAKDIEAIVVNWAKSGATLFCLGADKILMGDDAQLGPLDVQLKDPKTGKWYSALNAFKSLEYLQSYAISVLDMMAIYLQTKVGMDSLNATKQARNIFADVISPLLTQVNPSELGEARQYLAVGERYCNLVMERYAYADVPKHIRKEIVRELVWNYPSHSFVIDLEEAQRLGLKAEKLDDECTSLCETLLMEVRGCMGVFMEEATKDSGQEITAENIDDLAIIPPPNLEKEVSGNEIQQGAQAAAGSDGQPASSAS